MTDALRKRQPALQRSERQLHRSEPGRRGNNSASDRSRARTGSPRRPENQTQETHACAPATKKTPKASSAAAI